MTRMKTSTKVCIIFNVVSLVGSAILFPAIMGMVTYQPTFAFNFSAQAGVGTVFFLVWMMTGLILFVKFLGRLSFPRKLFFITVSSTAVFAFFAYSVYNINNINVAPVVAFRQVAVGNNYGIVYIFIGILAVLYFLFLSIAFRKISRPIKKINNIISNINGGVHKQNYKLGGSREFAEIGAGLTVLDKKIVEKEKLVRVANEEYEKIVPKQFLKFLGKKSYSDLELGNNVTKEVTTMFCDIRNSTIKSESFSLSENFKFINSYLQMIAPLVRRFGGFVDKYLGDGVLAVFCDAKNALDCSKEIVKMASIKNSLETNSCVFDIGIGIHTGEVVFGVVGEKERKSPTIISDNVNYASKMQDVNKIFGTTVLFSKRTLNSLKSEKNMSYRYVGSLDVGEGQNRFAMFELLDVLSNDQKNARIDHKYDFEQAVRLYDEKKFQLAKEVFESLCQKDPLDRASRVYVDKCKNKMGKMLLS